ncbi:MAG TPA: pyridoxamine 5'-phosphate oxidase family protein [Solirubrobacteraceae bacterium]|jgi:general stress protein 26|nr:pyridoxamine 5'-phosphate oxidase family protein [Solirubrobacteraceae bacterium]
MNRRELIAMSPAEVAAFLDEHRVVIAASNGVSGWPHLMPLWYLMRGEDVWAWTFAKSQKVRNLERDPRATLQAEDGEEYHELRGVMIEADVEIHRDLEVIGAFGAQLLQRYSGAEPSPEMLAAVRTQATKRVALQFVPRRTASFDHRKLGGVY